MKLAENELYLDRLQHHDHVNFPSLYIFFFSFLHFWLFHILWLVSRKSERATDHNYLSRFPNKVGEQILELFNKQHIQAWYHRRTFHTSRIIKIAVRSFSKKLVFPRHILELLVGNACNIFSIAITFYHGSCCFIIQHLMFFFWKLQDPEKRVCNIFGGQRLFLQFFCSENEILIILESVLID